MTSDIEDHALVEDEEGLIRTNYSPAHVHDGKLLPAAISSSDLSSRGFSVDREGLVCLKTMEDRINRQMANVPADRQKAWVSVVGCGSIRGETLPEDGQAAFRVIAEPLADNSAHAAIYSAVKRSPARIRALRDLLLPHLNKQLHPFSTFIAGRHR